VRKIIIYTTNSIESLNYQLREIIKNQGHFPNAGAVVKLLWLPIRDIEDKNHDQDAQNAPRVVPKARSITSGAIVAMRRATWAQIGPNDFSAQSHGALTPPPQSLIARPGVHDTTRPPIWGSRGREFKSRQPD
jgi:hypothetical protein